MPRQSRGVRKRYSPSVLNDAVAACKSGAVSMRKASSIYGIPLTTLHDHVSGKISSGALPGRGTVFPEEIEQQMVSKIQSSAQMGFGITRAQLINKAGKLARDMRLRTPWTGLEPGNDWLLGFMKRHPELALRQPVPLTIIRARMLNPTVTNKYFDDLAQVIQVNGLAEHPARIWNMDEKNIKLTHKPSKVLAAKGERNVPSRVGNCRETVSVLAAINAAGNKIPPMIIVKGKTQKSLNAYNVQDGPVGAAWTYQAKGYMEDILGGLWFEDHFLKHIGPERPQLLLLDGHSSHETLGLIEKARRAEVILLTLPPHTTHWLNPLDKTVFAPLEKDYNRVCSEFMATSTSAVVNKWEWPRLFNLAYIRSMTESNIISGFQACGVHPVNRHKIPMQAFHPSSVTDTALPNIPTTTQAPYTPDNPISMTPHTPEHTRTSDHSTIVTPRTSDHSTIVTPRTSDHSTIVTPRTSDHSTIVTPRTTDHSTIVTPHTSDHSTIVTPRTSDHSNTGTPAEHISSVIHQELVPLIPNFGDLQSLILEPVSTQEQATVEVLVDIANQSNLPTWSTSVDSIFVTPRSGERQTKTKTRKAITCHRILTSDAIYKQKMDQETIKQKELENKNKRKIEREDKKRLKEEKASKLKTRNSSLPQKKANIDKGMCSICCKSDLPYGGEPNKDILWVQCDSCHRWTHQVCIPMFLQDEMLRCVAESEMPFSCHLCL